jgi:hypothetical protein
VGGGCWHSRWPCRRRASPRSSRPRQNRDRTLSDLCAARRAGCARVFPLRRTLASPAVLGGCAPRPGRPQRSRRAAGGWFSERTVGHLRSARIMTASPTSASDRPRHPERVEFVCSALLLAQLERTAKQVPTIERAVYSFDGSRRAFYMAAARRAGNWAVTPRPQPRPAESQPRRVHDDAPGRRTVRRNPNGLAEWHAREPDSVAAELETSASVGLTRLRPRGAFPSTAPTSSGCARGQSVAVAVEQFENVLIPSCSSAPACRLSRPRDGGDRHLGDVVFAALLGFLQSTGPSGRAGARRAGGADCHRRARRARARCSHASSSPAIRQAGSR